MITPYVTIEGRPEFERNKTGFGYMVMDIAKAVGKIESVEVLATNTRGVSFEYEGVKFLKRSLLSYMLSIPQCLPLQSLLRIIKNYSMSNGTFFRLFYYWLMTGCLRKYLEEGQYDVVHIHGCGFALELWTEVFKRCGQKYVITLHGLTSFSESVGLEPAGKKYERVFLKRVADGEFIVTVISTGMKRIIENTYNKEKCHNIHVVCNSFSLNTSETQKVDIRNIYNIPDESRIILYVGNVCPRKNQGQFIKAFNLLPQQQKRNIYVLFLGGSYDKQYTIERFSEGTDYEDHMIACGVVDKELVSQYYMQSDGVALISLSEGFGLSLIEGLHFGLPCMLFADMEAYEDIYDECAMVGVTDHSDEAVANGIDLLLTKRWDEKKIRDYSKNFEPDTMAQNYLSVYKI